jgi:hypothetical protein
MPLSDKVGLKPSVVALGSVQHDDPRARAASYQRAQTEMPAQGPRLGVPQERMRLRFADHVPLAGDQR